MVQKLHYLSTRMYQIETCAYHVRKYIDSIVLFQRHLCRPIIHLETLPITGTFRAFTDEDGNSRHTRLTYYGIVRYDMYDTILRRTIE